MALNILAQEKVWLDKSKYVDAERVYNEKQSEKHFVNNNFFEKFNDDVQDPNNKSNENMKLTSNHSKHRQEYTNFFNHKIILLNKLRQYKDLVMKTLSYYCDGCDFITVEKYLWDIHNKTAHPIDINRSTVYCSTCAMFVCGNDQEHNLTIEHSCLLNFVKSLKPVEVLNDKNLCEKLFENCSVENCINLEKKEKTELNNIDCLKGSKYLNDDSSKINALMKKPSSNGKDQIMKNTSLLLDKTSKYEHKQDDINTNAEELIQSKITSTSNSLPNILMTNPYQGNVLVEKMPENINCIELTTHDGLPNPVEKVSTLVKSQNEIMSNLAETTCLLNSSLTNETQIYENIIVGELDKDQLYGEYVVQRLINIKNTTIKQHIKLEIDNIFYTNLKQLLSQEIQKAESIERNKVINNNKF